MVTQPPQIDADPLLAVETLRKNMTDAEQKRVVLVHLILISW